jgi:hypothetical protein
MSKQPLKLCPDCGREVSPSATRCPNCGRDTTSFASGIVFGLILFVIVGLLTLLGLVAFGGWGPLVKRALGLP